MTEVFFVDARMVDPDAGDVRAVCCAERVRKLERLRNEGAKRLCAAAELAMIKAVRYFFPAAELPIEYVRNENGKPYLRDYPGLYVNLSHSGDWAVCAASDSEVGVDIQRYKRVNPGLAERYFTAGEQEYIGADENRFFEVWAKKEAYLKALGVGITVPMDSFSVLASPELYTGITPPEPGYAVWVCTKKV